MYKQQESGEMNSIFTFQKSIILPAIIISNRQKTRQHGVIIAQLVTRQKDYTYSNELFAKCKEFLRIIHNELIKEVILCGVLYK